LKNAFSSGSTKTEASNGRPNPPKFVYQKARTDVMYSHSTSRDDAAHRAKERFRERSARKLMEQSSAGTTMTFSSSDRGEEVQQKKSHSSIVENKKSNLQDDLRCVSDNAVEDDSSVDFRAARNALVQRSKLNGHKVQVVNKVYLRAKKYEKLEEDYNRRKSSVHGLLKPTWDLTDTTKGCPSDSYERHFVSDVAPKKSFEDLP
jgi:hypothetical protein